MKLSHTVVYAGALMGLSSLAVMANSLLLQFQRPVNLNQFQPPLASSADGAEEAKGKDHSTFRLQKYAEKTLV